MPDKTYTISELAGEFGVTTRTIRFYEEKGLISPMRDGQKRLYTPADRVRIKLILRGKRIGMTLQECVDVIDHVRPRAQQRGAATLSYQHVTERRDESAATEKRYRRNAGRPGRGPEPVRSARWPTRTSQHPEPTRADRKQL